MTGKEVGKYIRSLVPKKGSKYLSPSSPEWIKIREDFKRIFWHILDQEREIDKEKPVPKSKRHIHEITIYSGFEINVVYGRDCWDYDNVTYTIASIEDEGKKKISRMLNLRLKYLEKEQEELLIRIGKNDAEIDEIKKRIN